MDYKAIIYVKKNWLGEGAVELLAFKVFDIDYRQTSAWNWGMYANRTCMYT